MNLFMFLYLLFFELAWSACAARRHPLFPPPDAGVRKNTHEERCIPLALFVLASKRDR